MHAPEHWLNLGWRHPMWDLHRFYLSLAKKNRKYKSDWEEELRQNRSIKLPHGAEFPVDQETVNLFFEYAAEREHQFAVAEDNLRTEKQALAFCEGEHIAVGRTATRSIEHHQSSKAMIAAVSAVAENQCVAHHVTLDPDPQERCMWSTEHDLHVSARNLDGAIPALANPKIVWEIKEYWGKTKGGSKMSDAVYECHLVGLELRQFEARGGPHVTHVVFIDGKEQWGSRQSDLRRLIDLMNQGLIDYLIVGREVEWDWGLILDQLLSQQTIEARA